MTYPNPATAMAEVIVDELARAGVRHVVASPGSRSTALLLAVDRHEDIDLVMQIDERSAAFRALGISLTNGAPAAVLTTSGSAVANLLPAVVEADRALVPLIVITADRPAEMVRRRANQTMNHRAVFEGFVREQVSFPSPSSDSDQNELWREGVASSILKANGFEGPPGPVHINVAFDEPTLPVSDDGRSQSDRYPFESPGAPDGGPWRSAGGLEAPPLPELPNLGARVVLAVGHGDFDVDSLTGACHSRGVAMMATSRSGVRSRLAIRGYDSLLVDGFPRSLEPTGAVVVGDLNPADVMYRALGPDLPVVHVDRWGIFRDPMGSMSVGVTGDPVAILDRLERQSDGWYDLWAEADAHVKDSVSELLEGEDHMTGPRLAHTMNSVEWDALVVASSLAARDIDRHIELSGPVFSNRGVSGIDGFVSTALGVASRFDRTVAYTGDLSFLHDANGFLGENLPSVVFVVMDNNGGGLFDLLPQARLVDEFDRLFITPPDRDLSLLAEFHGIRFTDADSPSTVIEAIEDGFQLDRPSVIRIRVDRSRDLALRRKITGLSRQALSDLEA